MPTISLEQYKNLLTSQNRLNASDISACVEFSDFEFLMRSKQMPEYPFTKKGLQRAWNLLVFVHNNEPPYDSYITRDFSIFQIADRLNCNQTQESINLSLKEVRKILSHINNGRGLKIFIPRSRTSVVRIQNMATLHNSYHSRSWIGMEYQTITRGPSTTEYVVPSVAAVNSIFRNPLTNLSSDIVFALASTVSS